uniref:RRM domain-containing protein n=1 Tax=Grammatophora oceanica TaxID=210454 RepID=A0A7S1UZW7_9STRA|mmetsp:Transcript_31524/g.46771  ORF Transcript_31524/g.46771 Transcript_31524/m.46771 type:complete len:334 (+) Transcript_31524:76-1077(+)
MLQVRMLSACSISILFMAFAIKEVAGYSSFVPRTAAQRQLEWASNPAFSLPSTASAASTANTLTMRVGKNSGKSKRLSDTAGDAKLGIEHRLKMANAGRPGTRRFVDPCKIFLGNVPFDADENDVKAFLKQYMGTVHHVTRVKIIRDWKTEKSKGYAFALFTDPVFATCAVEYCNEQRFMGRKITVDQGKKRLDPIIYVKQSNTEPATEEDAAILSGLEEAEGKEATEADFEAILNAQQELDTDQDDSTNTLVVDEPPADTFQQADDDDVLFGHDQTLMADEAFEFDGDFETEYPEHSPEANGEGSKLNREQRRKEQKGSKRSLPFTGFAELE